MSHHHHHHHGPPGHHPPGAPPPYGHHYPPHLHPPPPAAYAYLPTPVVMPMPVYPQPEPNPTYVTNYIYQQPSEPPTPVHVVDHAPPPSIQQPDFIEWIAATPNTASNLAHKAVVAGKEPGWNSNPLWVIRAHHSGDLVPGKLAITDRRAYIPHNGKEVPVHNFEVLCAPAQAIRWLPASNGNVPVGAIVAGNTFNMEPLYVGRARHFSVGGFGKTSLCPGKVHPSHGCLYISFNHVEVSHKDYEVLCKIVG